MVPEFRPAASVPDSFDVLGVPVRSDFSVPDGAWPPSLATVLDPEFLRRVGFEGRPGQVQVLPAASGVVVAIGVGASDAMDGNVLRRAGAAFIRHVGTARVAATTLALAAPELVGAAIEGMGLATYRYAGQKRSNPDRPLETVDVVGASDESVGRAVIAVEATLRARDWVNDPPRQMTPTRLAALAAELGAGAGVDVRVWGEEEIAAEHLGALAGVAAGGVEPARLIRLAYEPAGATQTIALVGKGITFDSGGLSLKPPASMMTMKDDMGGAAAVISAVIALAELQVGVSVVGWVAATENMPSGTATHPGDVLVARNGTSIEVLNTDAEGRLVLADALSLAVEEAPDAIVDIATLTGGQGVALGDGVAAIMGNDRALVDRVIDAGAKAGEPAWELPLVAAYRKQLDSDVGDLKNVTGTTRASSIMAALFLQEFVGDRKWAHLDIAYPAWSDKEDGWLSKGGTGWGARTLIELVSAWE